MRHCAQERDYRTIIQEFHSLPLQKKKLRRNQGAANPSGFRHKMQIKKPNANLHGNFENEKIELETYLTNIWRSCDSREYQRPVRRIAVLLSTLDFAHEVAEHFDTQWRWSIAEAATSRKAGWQRVAALARRAQPSKALIAFHFP
jgi:hypothetical protein